MLRLCYLVALLFGLRSSVKAQIDSQTFENAAAQPANSDVPQADPTSLAANG
jgi:hypothetical protein